MRPATNSKNQNKMINKLIRNPPVGESKRLTVSLSPEMTGYLENKAEKEGISLAEAIRQAISKAQFIEEQLSIDNGHLYIASGLNEIEL